MNALRSFLLAVVLACASVAVAEIPRLVNFQGYLADSGGQPVNTSVQMVLSIYTVPTGGSAVWSETRTVAVANGVYSVMLGSVTPLVLPFNVDYYLGVRVAADSEMVPRQQLAAAPYSLASVCFPGDSLNCYSGPPGTLGGLCKSGLRTCNPSGTGWSTCVAEVVPNCGTACGVNFQSDPANCGSCGHACAEGEACTAGACVATNACANGAPSQAFDAYMSGCGGSVTFANRASLCAASAHVCGSTEYLSRRGPVVPARIYWTNDVLQYSGTGSGTCAVTPSASFSCGGTSSMLVCSGTTDNFGNTCAWTDCGYVNNTPNEYFGGCSGTTAGTLCCLP